MIPALALIVPTALCAAEAPHVSIQWVDLPRSVYVGEVFPITLQVAVKADLLDEGLLQLFPQDLELPVQATGFGLLPKKRLSRIEVPEGAQRTRSLVLDGTVVRARDLGQAAGGNAQFAVTRWFVSPRPGSLELPAPSLHFATATQFQDDLVQGRVPLDRVAHNVNGKALTLSVEGAPETQDSLRFRGAVGSFDLSSTASPTRAAVGETIRLRVLVTSKTDRPVPDIRQDAIEIPAVNGFRETGRVVERVAEGVALEISLTSDDEIVGHVPTASLMGFDPSSSPASYYTVSAEGPLVQVTAAGPTTQVRAEPPSQETKKGVPYWTYGTLAFVFLLAVASVIRRHLPPRTEEPSSDAPRS